jgi:transposase-like protein
MRLKLVLPRVKVEEYMVLTMCPRGSCGATRFKLMRNVTKRPRDTALRGVVAKRYRCVRCGQTFRVYPSGVSRDQCSARLKRVAVLLYVLGLSYGAVALALQALGHLFGKTAVYNAVQAAGERV